MNKAYGDTPSTTEAFASSSNLQHDDDVPDPDEDNLDDLDGVDSLPG